MSDSDYMDEQVMYLRSLYARPAPPPADELHNENGVADHSYDAQPYSALRPGSPTSQGEDGFVLAGSRDYQRWSDDILVTMPGKRRKILARRETECPFPSDQLRAVTKWNARNEKLYAYIWDNLGSAIKSEMSDAQSVSGSGPRSAYRLWRDIQYTYGGLSDGEGDGNEDEDADIFDLLEDLLWLNEWRELCWAEKQFCQAAERIDLELANLGYPLGDGLLQGLANRGLSEDEKREIEVFLDRHKEWDEESHGPSLQLLRELRDAVNSAKQ